VHEGKYQEVILTTQNSISTWDCVRVNTTQTTVSQL